MLEEFEETGKKMIGIKKIAKAVLKLLLPDVTEHLLKVFKLEKVLAYVELPNEADKGVLKLQDQMNMMQGELKDMSKALDDVRALTKKVNKFKIG